MEHVQRERAPDGRTVLGGICPYCGTALHEGQGVLPGLRFEVCVSVGDVGDVVQIHRDVVVGGDAPSDERILVSHGGIPGRIGRKYSRGAVFGGRYGDRGTVVVEEFHIVGTGDRCEHGFDRDIVGHRGEILVPVIEHVIVLLRAQLAGHPVVSGGGTRNYIFLPNQLVILCEIGHALHVGSDVDEGRGEYRVLFYGCGGISPTDESLAVDGRFRYFGHVHLLTVSDLLGLPYGTVLELECDVEDVLHHRDGLGLGIGFGTSPVLHITVAVGVGGGDEVYAFHVRVYCWVVISEGIAVERPLVVYPAELVPERPDVVTQVIVAEAEHGIDPIRHVVAHSVVAGVGLYLPGPVGVDGVLQDLSHAGPLGADPESLLPDLGGEDGFHVLVVGGEPVGEPDEDVAGGYGLEIRFGVHDAAVDLAHGGDGDAVGRAGHHPVVGCGIECLHAPSGVTGCEPLEHPPVLVVGCGCRTAVNRFDGGHGLVQFHTAALLSQGLVDRFPHGLNVAHRGFGVGPVLVEDVHVHVVADGRRGLVGVADNDESCRCDDCEHRQCQQCLSHVIT